MPPVALNQCCRGGVAWGSDSCGVQAGRYQYRLTAWNSYGWSPPAQASNCTVPAGACPSAQPHPLQAQPALTGILIALVSVMAIGLGAAYLGFQMKGSHKVLIVLLSCDRQYLKYCQVLSTCNWGQQSACLKHIFPHLRKEAGASRSPLLSAPSLHLRCCLSSELGIEVSYQDQDLCRWSCSGAKQIAQNVSKGCQLQQNHLSKIIPDRGHSG